MENLSQFHYFLSRLNKHMTSVTRELYWMTHFNEEIWLICD